MITTAITFVVSCVCVCVCVRVFFSIQMFMTHKPGQAKQGRKSGSALEIKARVRYSLSTTFSRCAGARAKKQARIRLPDESERVVKRIIIRINRRVSGNIPYAICAYAQARFPACVSVVTHVDVARLVPFARALRRVYPY